MEDVLAFYIVIQYWLIQLIGTSERCVWQQWASDSLFQHTEPTSIAELDAIILCASYQHLP